jgi:hypothetical protein
MCNVKGRKRRDKEICKCGNIITEGMDCITCERRIRKKVNASKASQQSTKKQPAKFRKAAGRIINKIIGTHPYPAPRITN